MHEMTRLMWGTMRVSDVGAALVMVDAREWMISGVDADVARERAARRLRTQVDLACVAIQTAGVP